MSEGVVRSEAESDLRKAQRMLGFGVWKMDVATRILTCSEIAFDLYGACANGSEISFDSFVQRVHPDDRASIRTRFDSFANSTETHFNFEHRVLKPDGQVAHLRGVGERTGPSASALTGFVQDISELVASRERQEDLSQRLWASLEHTSDALISLDRAAIQRNDAGEPVDLAGGGQRVAERRQIDERLRQSQKLEAIGELTGGIAHDFNNLLTVILANTELLGENLVDLPQLRALSEMTAVAAERGAQLTHRLLAFARRQPLEPRVVDINRLVVGMGEILRRTLPATITIKVLPAERLWMVEVDPTQLEAALFNLAINSRDAMPRGGHLTIETANVKLDAAYGALHPDVEPGQYVMIRVADTGVGMTPDVLATAVEPFFTTKAVGKGTGLGLSMVYGFVKQAGGHAEVESEPGRGATVSLYLPRAAVLSVPPEVKVEYSAPPGGDEKILVVEDDALVRENLAVQLSGLGYRVIAADSGPRALRILEQQADIHLLFTDIVMAEGMSGYQLAAAASRLRPGLKVLFTTGYSGDALGHHGRLDPDAHLLNKPYRRQTMLEKVRAVLDEPVI
jgi:signal transduction histidine kinase/CheY-like chemotaxis protein